MMTLGCLLGDLVDMKVRDLDEMVKTAFDADIVDEMVIGDYDDYINAFEEYPDLDHKRAYKPIIEYYKEWHEIIEEREKKEAIWKAKMEQEEEKRRVEAEAKSTSNRKTKNRH
ncbi:MAG: hypothetical protein HC803_04590 [Saprospiraceae bacterium]|nr:hypothetical protein [Saprospiraceae bacterium]